MGLLKLKQNLKRSTFFSPLFNRASLSIFYSYFLVFSFTFLLTPNLSAVDGASGPAVEIEPTSILAMTDQERPTQEKLDEILGAGDIGATHKAKLIECLTKLQEEINRLIQQPQAKIDDVLKNQADVSMLRVARAFLEFKDQYGARVGGEDQDALRQQISNQLRLSNESTSDAAKSAERDQMAETLINFYKYIGTYQAETDNPFVDADKRNDLMKALQRYTTKKYGGLSNYEKSAFTVTTTDAFVMKNLYSRYRPGTTPEGESTLMDTVFNQLGRQFKARDLGTSDRNSACYNMTGRSNCQKKSDTEGSYNKYEDARKKFVAFVKEELKKFLKRPDDPHKCADFIDPNTLKFKKINNKDVSPLFCSAGELINSLTSTSPFDEVEKLLNFIRPNNVSLRNISPQYHARNMFHNFFDNQCKFTRRADGDWEVCLKIYVEHMHGNNPSTAQWFINTGKPHEAGTGDNAGLITQGGKQFFECNPRRANYSSTQFATAPGCIDLPMYHQNFNRDCEGNPVTPNNNGHDTMMYVKVRLGDTRQNFVRMLGRSLPTDERGAGIRPASEFDPRTGRLRPGSTHPAQLTGDINLMDRRLELTNCIGKEQYYGDGDNASKEVRSIEIIKDPATSGNADLMAIGLKRNFYILNAKTGPTALTNGTYRWSCLDPAQVPPSATGDGGNPCSKISRYHPTDASKTENASFPRLDQDYTVQVEYWSSVQRPERPPFTAAPVVATIVIPKKRSITFAFEDVTDPAPAAGFSKKKLVYTGDEDLAEINHSTATWEWKGTTPANRKCKPQGADYTNLPADKKSAVDAICATPPQLNQTYDFPIITNSYQIIAQWKRPSFIGGNEGLTAETIIDGSGNSLELIETAVTDTAHKFKPMLQAMPNVTTALNQNLRWKCNMPTGVTAPAPCNQSATHDTEATFPKLSNARDYTVYVASSFLQAGASREIRSEPKTVTGIAAPQFGDPIVTIEEGTNTPIGPTAQYKAKVRSNGESLPLSGTRSFVWECDPVVSNCAGAVTNDTLQTFNRTPAGYTLKAKFESTNGKTAEASIHVAPYTPPAFAVPSISITRNEEAAIPELNVELKATLRFTPADGQKHPRISYKWICPEGMADCGGDIPGDEGIRQFPMGVTATYEVQVAYVEQVGPGATATYTIPQKPAVPVPTTPAPEVPKLEVSEDKTPEDNDKAKFESTVYQSANSITTIEFDGTIEWKCKGEGIEEYVLTGTSINPDRKDKDQTCKVKMKKGSDYIGNEAEAIIKKKKAAEGSNEEPVVPALEDIPPSPAPPRFQPIILPPPPGMMLVPGFD